MVNEEPRRRAQHGSKLWLCTAVASKKVSLPATFWNKDSPLSCGNILTDEHGPILDQSALLPFAQFSHAAFPDMLSIMCHSGVSSKSFSKFSHLRTLGSMVFSHHSNSVIPKASVAILWSIAPASVLSRKVWRVWAGWANAKLGLTPDACDDASSSQVRNGSAPWAFCHWRLPPRWHAALSSVLPGWHGDLHCWSPPCNHCPKCCKNDSTIVLT